MVAGRVARGQGGPLRRALDGVLLAERLGDVALGPDGLVVVGQVADGRGRATRRGAGRAGRRVGGRVVGRGRVARGDLGEHLVLLGRGGVGGDGVGEVGRVSAVVAPSCSARRASSAFLARFCSALAAFPSPSALAAFSFSLALAARSFSFCLAARSFSLALAAFSFSLALAAFSFSFSFAALSFSLALAAPPSPSAWPPSPSPSPSPPSPSPWPSRPSPSPWPWPRARARPCRRSGRSERPCGSPGVRRGRGAARGSEGPRVRRDGNGRGAGVRRFLRPAGGSGPEEPDRPLPRAGSR